MIRPGSGTTGGTQDGRWWIPGAPSLLEKQKWGNWVINKDYNAAMPAEAVCKPEGFKYAPSDATCWQHGHSTERDLIYVTTAHLGDDQLQQLSDQVGPDRTLLVPCTAFRPPAGQAGAKPDGYPNPTVKKLPKAPQKPGQLIMFGEEAK